jgi:hypothetical protein
MGDLAGDVVGDAADGEVRVSIGQGGLVFTAWAAAIACAGTVVVARRDIT